MQTYGMGSLVRVTVAFADDTGAPVDPAVVTVAVKSPDGAQIAGSVVRADVGSYYADLPTTQLGVWSYIWTADGIDANPGSFLVTDEAPSLAAPPPFTGPSPIDLTTVELVKGMSGIQTDKNLRAMQLCITAASLEFLWRTGMAEEDGTPTTKSLFVEPVQFDELYDGGGGDRQFTRRRPIRYVQHVLVDGVEWIQSRGAPSRGWAVSGDKKSIVLRGGIFCSGTENVRIVYIAGYDATPGDIVRAITQLVSINYRRPGWLDLASKTESIGGVAGTTAYRAWEFPPEVQSVIRYYRRQAFV